VKTSDNATETVLELIYAGEWYIKGRTYIQCNSNTVVRLLKQKIVYRTMHVRRFLNTSGSDVKHKRFATPLPSQEYRFTPL
jgi:hypothetical protein